MGAINQLYNAYKHRAEFLMVYIKEAHPSDGWQVPANRRQGIEVPQPRTLDERRAVCSRVSIAFPAVVDGMDDAVNTSYAAWPDRIYVVGRDGRVVYAGAPAPAASPAVNWKLCCGSFKGLVDYAPV